MSEIEKTEKLHAFILTKGKSIVTTLMLYQVGISGIIMSLAGYYIERFLK